MSEKNAKEECNKRFIFNEKNKEEAILLFIDKLSTLNQTLNATIGYQRRIMEQENILSDEKIALKSDDEDIEFLEKLSNKMEDGSESKNNLLHSLEKLKQTKKQLNLNNFSKKFYDTAIQSSLILVNDIHELFPFTQEVKNTIINKIRESGRGVISEEKIINPSLITNTLQNEIAKVISPDEKGSIETLSNIKEIYNKKEQGKIFEPHKENKNKETNFVETFNKNKKLIFDFLDEVSILLKKLKKEIASLVKELTKKIEEGPENKEVLSVKEEPSPVEKIKTPAVVKVDENVSTSEISEIKTSLIEEKYINSGDISHQNETTKENPETEPEMSIDEVNDLMASCSEQEPVSFSEDSGFYPEDSTSVAIQKR